MRSRHPWLYDRALRPLVAELPPGDVVAVLYKKEMLGLGLYDPESPLRVRLLSWDATVMPDEAWAVEVATAAAARRRADPRLQGCTGVRLLHGENDWAPGLMLDMYAGYGVVSFDGTACEAFWKPMLAKMVAAFASAGFVLKGIVKKGGTEVLLGEAPPEEALIFEEKGVRFEVDVRLGMKTGFFLDQRENRRRLREMAADKEVLDLFAYTGGFSVSAALGGAKRTTTVDYAGPAMAACQRNFALNGFEAETLDTRSPLAFGADSASTAHRLFVSDCWKFLQQAAKHGESFDIVVNDPPSMAPSEQARPQALKKYTELNEGALKVLRPGGLLLACSCSSHITAADLQSAVKHAGVRARRELCIEAEERAATDHPVRRGFPEGDYLQALYVRIKD